MTTTQTLFSPPPPSNWNLRVLKAGLLVLGLVSVNSNLFSIAQAAGPSMDPTINELGAMVFINKFWKKTLSTDYSVSGYPKTMHRGDVVCSKSPIDPGRPNVIKRIVGLPGDIIRIPYWPHLWRGYYPPLDSDSISNQKIFTGYDYEEESEPKEDGDDIIVRIPHGHVWLEGDNPEFSRDSRYYGPVPINLLQGKVVAVLNYAEGVSGFHTL